MDTDKPTFTALELESVKPMPEVEKITNLSRDSIERHHKDKITRLSPGRVGMRLKDALRIASGK